MAVFATLAAFAGLIAVTQVSAAESRRGGNTSAACPRPTGGGTPTTTAPTTPVSPSAAGAAHDHGDATTGTDAGAAEAAGAAVAEQQRRRTPDRRCRPTTGPTAAPTTPSGGGAPLEILGDSCADSRLPAHDGFQVGGRCVSTEFGEVGPAANNPTLLISQAPSRVRVNRPFTLQVSTRNLVRDRFLPAKDGGYYKESAYLTPEGLVRGHFHVACRMLSGRQAPDPAPAPAFFAATEDGRGGATPDTVTVQIPGLPSTGIAQCAAWAGDGSHRPPMMERANQIPAFDAVRVVVTR